ncbi:zinc finger protein 511 lethal (2) k10201 [Megalopta genalis]|uniref:zinc finger protein 511 lethal (2) k10201 n=1 Tax=Megalopta genalis TaxID=115081 RepID=UPI003FD38415
MEKVEEFLQDIGIGLRPVNDLFFEDSYRVCKIFQRKGVIVEDDEELCHDFIKQFSCFVTGCDATFKTLVEYEIHYNSSHRYVCAECRKFLPNPRLLDIHLQENHDSFFQVLSEKQPMYQCYLSECDVKSKNAIERREHCIKVHKFPKNFRYDNAFHSIRNEPKDKMDVEEPENEKEQPKQKRVQLNKNQKTKMFPPSSAKPTIPVNFNVNDSHLPIAYPSKSSSSLVFVPRQVQRSYTKALTKNQSSEKNVLETENMMDLAVSLPT